MEQKLYDEVLQHIKEQGHRLLEYGDDGRVGDVPHHIWYNIRYLPSSSGKKILKEDLRCEPYTEKFEDQIYASKAYDLHPYVTNYDSNLAIYVGRAGFCRYSASELCFVVAQYSDGYDEVMRNCMPWGKLFKNGIPSSITAKVVCTTVIWYSFCEVCEKFSWAKDGIRNNTEETYNVLRDYIQHVLHFSMLEYEEFVKRGFMVVERTGVREHINLCGSKLYCINDHQGKCVVRFCYNTDTIVMEWRDGKTHLSNHASLVMPTLSCENFIWMMDRGNKDPGFATKLCLAGFLARYDIRLNWHEAVSWLYTYPMEWLNARSTGVLSFNDVL